LLSAQIKSVQPVLLWMKKPNEFSTKEFCRRKNSGKQCGCSSCRESRSITHTMPSVAWRLHLLFL
jgi:hypothetical protein